MIAEADIAPVAPSAAGKRGCRLAAKQCGGPNATNRNAAPSRSGNQL
jgi:hypothetical protein